MTYCSLTSLPLLFTTIDGGSFIQCACSDPKHTVLILSKKTTIYLAGAFAFQLLYGFVEVNGYLFYPKKYNAANFINVSIPTGHMPAYFTIREALSEELHIEKIHSPTNGFSADSASKLHLFDRNSRIQSRLREFVNDPKKVVTFVEEHSPVAILLIRTEMDIASKFIQQQNQRPVNLFPPIGRSIGDYLNFLNTSEEQCKCLSAEDVELHKVLQTEYRTVLYRVYQYIAKERNCVVFLAGNKGAGKSTMARFLINALNTGTLEQPPRAACRVFLLDTDVGQSELCPSGCISLYEVKKPLIGVPFASPVTTLPNSYFFGSNSPVDFDLYLKLIEHLLAKFKGCTMDETERFVLIVNSLGWIEDLGCDLMLRILRLVKPTILVNLQVGGILDFTVPELYRKITVTIRRPIQTSGNPNLLGPKLPPSQLRSFLTAGYTAQLFLQPSVRQFSALRLAELTPFRIRFSSISIFLHPELRHIDDNLILSFLNCSFVALCTVEDGFEKNFERKQLLHDSSLPYQLELRSEEHNSSSESGLDKGQEGEEEDVLPVERKIMPILRCVGFGLIRAINPQRKLFYILTPMDPQVLKQVNVFACGHCINVPDLILFDPKIGETAPFVVELDSGLQDHHKKMYSGLKTLPMRKKN